MNVPSYQTRFACPSPVHPDFFKAGTERKVSCIYILRIYIHPIYYFRHSFSCHLPIDSRDSDPGSHSRLFHPPPPDYGTRLAFLSREDISTLLPRRLASNFAYPSHRCSQQLLPMEKQKLHLRGDRGAYVQYRRPLCRKIISGTPGIRLP